MSVYKVSWTVVILFLWGFGGMGGYWLLGGFQKVKGANVKVAQICTTHFNTKRK